MKNSSEIIGNRTRHLSACTSLLQLPREATSGLHRLSGMLLVECLYVSCDGPNRLSD